MRNRTSVEVAVAVAALRFGWPSSRPSPVQRSESVTDTSPIGAGLNVHGPDRPFAVRIVLTAVCAAF